MYSKYATSLPWYCCRTANRFHFILDANTHATLHVLDATTGEPLFSSQDIIPTATHLAGMAVGDSHVFFTDRNGVLYAFGIALEH